MPLRVFLVEDFPHMHLLMNELLSCLGGTIVGRARTEAEANLWLDEHPGEWDVAVIDLVLDQGSGIGVVAHCKAQPRGGKVAVFSSFATPGVRKHCLKLGADAVFDKTETAPLIEWLRDAEGLEEQARPRAS